MLKKSLKITSELQIEYGWQKKNKNYTGDEEMAQQLRKSTGCSPRGPGFDLSTHMAAHNFYTYSPRGSNTSFWPP